MFEEISFSCCRQAIYGKALYSHDSKALAEKLSPASRVRVESPEPRRAARNLIRDEVEFGAKRLSA